MSEILHSHQLKIGDKSYTIRPIQRFVADGGAQRKEDLDDYGFRQEGWFLRSSRGIGIEDLLLRGDRGGLLIGEGDVGKTWFVEMLDNASTPEMLVKTLRLRSFLDDRRALVREAQEFWGLLSGTIKNVNLVLDGLDENEGVLSVIVEICSRIPDFNRCRVWITSRVCNAAKELSQAGCVGGEYHLLPFSQSDIRDLARMVGADGEEFLTLLKRKCVTSFAAKPGGAVLLLKLFVCGRLQELSRIQLLEEIAKAFARDARDGCQVLANDEEYGDAEIVDAASWIATRIFFGQKVSLWMGLTAECPVDALPYEELSKGQYSSELLSETTKRRLFEPLSVERFRIACDTQLSPFLVAHWIKDHVPTETIPSMLRLGSGVGDRLSAVLKWLALFDVSLARGWVDANPKAFLDCPDVIRDYGVEGYYGLLEDEYSRLAEFDRDAFVSASADQLVGQDYIARVALRRLQSSACLELQADLASRIIRHTRTLREEGLQALIGFLERRWLELDGLVRHDLVYELSAMHGEGVHPDSVRLKGLLAALTVNSEVDEGPKGCLLNLLWPKYLTVQEVVKYLTRPIRENFGSSYKMFLWGRFPASFEKTITESNVELLLTWAVDHIGYSEHQDSCGDLAKDVFTYAWQWADRPPVAKLLAQCLFVCGDRKGFFHFEMPFCDSQGRSDINWGVSVTECERDRAKRFAVLEAMVDDTAHGDECYKHLFVYGDRPGLYCPGEFLPLYEMWQARRARLDQEVQARHLAFSLEVLSRWSPRDRFLIEREELFKAYPEMGGFDLKRLLADDEVGRTSKREFDVREDRLKKAKLEAERQHTEKVKNVLREEDSRPDMFLRYSCMIQGVDKRDSYPCFNVEEGPQWKRLDSRERAVVYRAAERMAREFWADKIGMSWALAFAGGVCLAWNQNRPSLQSLSGDRWGQIVYLMLHASFDHDSRESVDEIFNWAFLNHQVQSEQGALRAVEEELEESTPSGMALRTWEKLATDALFQRLVEKYGDNAEIMQRVLGCAFDARRRQRCDFPAVAKYCEKCFLNNALSEDRDWWTVVALIISLYPKVYVPKIVALLDGNATFVHKWLEFVMGGGVYDYVNNAFQHSAIEDSARFYIWLNGHYPDAERPEHDGGYSPTSVDEIYVLKMHLSNRLLDEPMASTLEMLKVATAAGGGANGLERLSRGVAERYRRRCPPESVPATFFEKIAVLERPIGSFPARELKRVVRSLNKELVHCNTHGHSLLRRLFKREGCVMINIDCSDNSKNKTEIHGGISLHGSQLDMSRHAEGTSTDSSWRKVVPWLLRLLVTFLVGGFIFVSVKFYLKTENVEAGVAVEVIEE